jgi:hypothetical protein
MFRRIEFIVPGRPDDPQDHPPFLAGLMVGSQSDEVIDAWIEDLRGPTRSSLPANCRFYFTEKGWREVGSKVAAAAQRTGSAYRVIKIKETDAQVVWRDKVRGYEVAVQPPSRLRSAKAQDRSVM